MAPRGAAFQQLDATDFDDAVALFPGEAGRLGVEDDLPHAVAPLR